MQKSTSLAFETILITHGFAQNINYHEERMNRTRRELFGCEDFLKLDMLFEKNIDDRDNFRCKVIYGKQIESVDIVLYQKQKITQLKVVEADIVYPYKLLDRSCLEALFALRGYADDIIIVREGLVTDTSIANIAVYDGNCWLTPKEPLLNGTIRQKLLHEGFVKEADIFAEDLSKYKKISIMNALRGFDELVEFSIEFDSRTIRQG